MTGPRRRALGQHFLRDPAIARAIVDLVAPGPADLAVEIGAGEGALTVELARRAGHVVALEIDGALAARLRARLPAVEVLEADARSWDYGALTRPARGRTVVVGNLPYSVGTRILLALLRAPRSIDAMALMLQREVAERVTAAPGGRAYGSLSVLAQLRWDARIALRVSPGAFRPPPEVDSAVLALAPLAVPRVAVGDEAWFERVVRAAFAQRRKMLGNALAGGLARPVAEVRAALASLGIDPARRAETLTILELATVAAGLR